jgi:hypothetical protein
MAQHIKAVGILHIAMSAMGLLAGIIILLIFGGLATLVGLNANDHDAAVAAPILGVIGVAIAAFLIVLSLPGFIAGWGLLSFRPWARTLTLVISAFDLLNVPLGTALAAYSFWALLSAEGSAMFDRARYGAYPVPQTQRPGMPIR